MKGVFSERDEREPMLAGTKTPTNHRSQTNFLLAFQKRRLNIALRSQIELIYPSRIPLSVVSPAEIGLWSVVEAVEDHDCILLPRA